MKDWWTDTRMLAAGNARRLTGGDPMAMPVSPAAPDGTMPSYDPRYLASLAGDLDAHAARLGVPVETLVAARLGRHRAPRRSVRQIVRGWLR